MPFGSSPAGPAVPQLVVFLRDPEASFVVTNLHPPGSILGASGTLYYAKLAEQTLVFIGPGAVPALLKAMDDDSPPLRHNAAVVLGRISEPDKEKPGSSVAVDPRVTKALSAYLQSNAPNLSVDDLKAIGFGKSPEAVRELVFRLKQSTNYETRADSALALGAIKAPESLPALKAALATDHENLVRQFSAKALGNFNLPAVTSDALAVALVKDKGGDVRAECAEALKGAKSPQAVKALIRALGDDYHEVRLNAAAAFWRIKSKDAVPALIRALKKESDDLTRDYILHALIHQNATEALPAIDQILKDKSKAASHDTAQFAKDVLTGKRPPPADDE